MCSLHNKATQKVTFACIVSTIFEKFIFRKIIALDIHGVSGLPIAVSVYDIEENSWETKEVNHGRGLLNIQGLIFLIDYNKSPEGNVEKIRFIPFDLETGFQYENRVVRDTNFSIPITPILTPHVMFARPVTFLLRNLETIL